MLIFLKYDTYQVKNEKVELKTPLCNYLINLFKVYKFLGSSILVLDFFLFDEIVVKFTCNGFLLLPTGVINFDL